MSADYSAFTPEFREKILKDLPAARARAYSHGAWACPSCKEGWQVYMINTDMQICWRCGYKGGEVSPNHLYVTLPTA